MATITIAETSSKTSGITRLLFDDVVLVSLLFLFMRGAVSFVLRGVLLLLSVLLIVFSNFFSANALSKISLHYYLLLKARHKKRLEHLRDSAFSSQY